MDRRVTTLCVVTEVVSFSVVAFKTLIDTLEVLWDLYIDSTITNFLLILTVKNM